VGKAFESPCQKSPSAKPLASFLKLFMKTCDAGVAA
jgi:hypothetical protein